MEHLSQIVQGGNIEKNTGNSLSKKIETRLVGEQISQQNEED